MPYERFPKIETKGPIPTFKGARMSGYAANALRASSAHHYAPRNNGTPSSLVPIYTAAGLQIPTPELTHAGGTEGGDNALCLYPDSRLGSVSFGEARGVGWLRNLPHWFYLILLLLLVVILLEIFWKFRRFWMTTHKDA